MGKRGFLGLAACLAVPLAALAAELGPAETDALRERAREAFIQGDYEAMAKAYEPVVAWALAQFDEALKERRSLSVSERVDDCLGLGHAYQLAGNWAKAVAAYQSALAIIEATLKIAPIGVAGRPLPEPQQNNLKRDYATYVHLIGCIQRDELKDPEAAAATFAKALEHCPPLMLSVEELRDQYLKRLSAFIASKQAPRDFAFESAMIYPRQALRELAITQGQLGQLQAAIESWTKLNLTRPLFRGAGVLAADIAPLGALLQKLPGSQPAPRIPMLLVLSPVAPATALDMDDPHTQLSSCGWWGSGGSDYWQFALCPSFGQEFETLQFTCDLEQTDPRYGGQFKCWARTMGEEAGTVDIGSIGWSVQRPAGREVIARTFDIPRGAGVVYIEAGIAPGKFKVHRVTARARFRPWEELAARPQGVQPKADVWMQSECLPPDGVLIRNGERIQPGTATSGMRPGRYAFTYRSPDSPETFRCEVDFAPAGHYGLFINLDSPFRWTLTDLRGFAEHPPSRASLVRLPDGRWLAAYGSRDSKVLLSTSADGAKWEKPWPLPHGSIGDRVEPTLHLDSKGTLWLAYFDNRLAWPTASTSGYQLWLASSRDGREWSRPRPVLVARQGARAAFWREFGSAVAWPCGAAQLLEGPDGRHWLFWRGYLACAETPETLRELRPIPFEGGAQPDVRSTHVAIDPAGRLHMVLHTGGEGICYSASADGRQWSAPQALGIEARGVQLSGAQLILDGAHAALLYGTSHGAWLCRGAVEPAPKFAPPVKISNHVIPLCGSRACITRDGQVALLVGKDSAWLLRADKNTLSRPVYKF